jgi:putative ABC transport system permease protein
LSLAVILTLALSIAANATVFSLLKPTVLRTIAAPDPEALAAVSGTDAKTNAYSAIHLSVLDALRGQQQSFTTLAAYLSSIVRVELDGNAFDIAVEGVTPGYFEVFGARAAPGRLLTADDDPLAAVGVISERLAARLFGDGDAVGRTILVDSRPVEIVGVVGGGFVGVRMDGGDDLFLPLAYLRAIQSGDFKTMPRAQQLVGRLAPGVSVDAARAEILGRWPAVQSAVAAGLPAAQRAAIADMRLSVESFSRGFSGIRDRYGPSLLLVMGLALSLLAVGCVNLSGLMLARGITRQHEFAVRVALGVSRARLLQQTLIDGVLLSLAAFAIAVPLSWWASAILTSMVSVARAIPLDDTAPDWSVLVLAAVASIVAGLAISVLPARRALTASMDDVLRGRGVAQRLRGSARAMLITQIAASMILVVGAGLFGSSLANLYANDVTPRDNPILFTRLARSPLERAVVLGESYFQTLQQSLGSIPGADAAAFSLSYPAYLGFFTPMPMDTVSAGGVQARAVADYVSPGFFELYSIARMRGRDFTWNDNGAAPAVVIVNETLARALTGSLEVVGQRLQMVSGQTQTDAEIVGVVADATVSSIRERHVAGLYRPLMQDLRRGQSPMAHVRVTGSTSTVQRGYVETVNKQGRHFVRALFTMDAWVDNAVVEQRLLAGMASVAATLALFLAAVGLFGMLAYSVSSRVREIGIRVSLGATRGEVVRMVVRDALAVAIPGIAIGIPLALAASWIVRSQLYGIGAADPWTIAGAILLFTATAAVAAWLPARRAARIQPNVALRHD